MNETPSQRQYRDDAVVLGEIGELLARAEMPTIPVRLPQRLAQLAVEAWERTDEGPLPAETFEQRILRFRAATLALIGLSITERSYPDGDDVVVELYPSNIGAAIEAADDLPST